MQTVAGNCPLHGRAVVAHGEDGADTLQGTCDWGNHTVQLAAPHRLGMSPLVGGGERTAAVAKRAAFDVVNGPQRDAHEALAADFEELKSDAIRSPQFKDLVDAAISDALNELRADVARANAEIDNIKTQLATTAAASQTLITPSVVDDEHADPARPQYETAENFGAQGRDAIVEETAPARDDITPFVIEPAKDPDAAKE